MGLLGKALGWTVGLIAAGLETLRDARRLLRGARSGTLAVDETAPVPLERTTVMPSSRYDGPVN